MVASELFLKATACLSSLLSLPGTAQTSLGSRTVAGGSVGGGDFKASNQRPGWKLTTVKNPAGTEVRGCIQGTQWDSNLKLAPCPKTFHLAGFPLPPTFTHPGSDPMAAQECRVMPLPFQVGLRGLGCLDLGIWGWTMEPQVPLTTDSQQFASSLGSEIRETEWPRDNPKTYRELKWEAACVGGGERSLIV